MTTFAAYALSIHHSADHSIQWLIGNPVTDTEAEADVERCPNNRYQSF